MNNEADMKSQERFYVTKWLILIIVLCWGSKYFSYHMLDYKYALKYYLYSYEINRMEKADLYDLKEVFEGKNNGVQVFFVGRKSCGDCKDAIGRIGQLRNWIEHTRDVGMQYIGLPDELEDLDREFLVNNVNVNSIPAIVISTNAQIKVFDFDTIMYDKNIKQIINHITGGCYEVD